jgi:hypothetical protein
MNYTITSVPHIYFRASKRAIYFLDFAAVQVRFVLHLEAVRSSQLKSQLILETSNNLKRKKLVGLKHIIVTV